MLTELQGFIDQVHEAQALLARKDEVEREIVEAERRRDKAKGEVDAAQMTMGDILIKINDESARHEYEKRRYSLSLDLHQKDIAGKKQELEAQHQDALRKSNAEHQAHLIVLASERQALEEGLKGLRAQHDQLRLVVQELKQRLGTLAQ